MGAKLSSRGSTSIAGMYQTWSSGSKLSPCSKYWLWTRRIDLCLMRRLAAPYLLRRLAGPYLMRRLAAPYLLRRLAAPYLLRRHYSLVFSSGPKVAFVTPAIIVDCSNIEWFCLNIRKTKEHKNADNARVSYYSFYITSLDTVILVSTPKKTVTAYPDHIVGAKAKAATKRKALLSRNNLLVQLKSVD
ncbi:hypothetical protein Tco_1071826 [Tanacetum coccineum]